MNLHLTKVITLVGALFVAFAAGGAATRMFNVDISWQGVSQPQEVSPDTSKTKQPTDHPTTILKQDNYRQGSVKSSTSERGTDPYVKCYSDEKCGGGFITVSKSECANQKCCEYSPGKWKNMSESGCSEAQNDSYDKLHIVPSLTPTSTPVPDPIRIAAIKTAIQQAELYKSKANLAWEQMLEYKKEQLNCGPRTRENAIQSAEKGVPLSPSSQYSIQKTCEDGYQPLIDEFRVLYENASYQYNEYLRHANKLLSECSGCAQYLKINK